MPIRLRKLFLLRKEKLLLLFFTFASINAVRAGLWRLSYDSLQKTLSRLSESQFFCSWMRRYESDTVVWAVNVASLYSPGKVKCLARALVTHWLLSGSGCCPQLKIGVLKTEAGKIEAHAWVEEHGKVVIGLVKQHSQFAPFDL